MPINKHYADGRIVNVVGMKPEAIKGLDAEIAESHKAYRARHGVWHPKAPATVKATPKTPEVEAKKSGKAS